MWKFEINLFFPIKFLLNFSQMENVATVLETCANWLDRFILLGEQRFMSRVLRSLNLIRKGLNSDILVAVLAKYLAPDHTVWKTLKVNTVAQYLGVSNVL